MQCRLNLGAGCGLRGKCCLSNTVYPLRGKMAIEPNKNRSWDVWHFLLFHTRVQPYLFAEMRGRELASWAESIKHVKVPVQDGILYYSIRTTCTLQYLYKRSGISSLQSDVIGRHQYYSSCVDYVLHSQYVEITPLIYYESLADLPGFFYLSSQGG